MDSEINREDDIFLRQRNFLDPDKYGLDKIWITMAAAGGIGSWLLLELVKTGFRKIEIYDHDIVKNHNRGFSLFGKKDIGKPKVICLRNLIKRMEGINISAHFEKFKTQEFKKDSIVIVTVDDMDVRREIWQRVKFNSRVKFYVEARTGLGFTRIYTVNPNDYEDAQYYENPLNLYSQAETVEAACGGEQEICAFVNNGAAVLMAAKIAQFIINPDKPPKKEAIFYFLPEFILLQSEN